MRALGQSPSPKSVPPIYISFKGAQHSSMSVLCSSIPHTCSSRLLQISPSPMTGNHTRSWPFPADSPSGTFKRMLELLLSGESRVPYGSTERLLLPWVTCVLLPTLMTPKCRLSCPFITSHPGAQP